MGSVVPTTRSKNTHGNSSSMRKRLRTNQKSTVRVGDVAKFVGYSTATVSRALNGQPGVSAEVREKVRKAGKKLGYLPNSSARALRMNRTQTIGAVIPTLNHAIYARMVEGIQKRLSVEGYGLLHTTSGYDLETECHQAMMLIERGVQGLVLVGHTHHDDLYDLLDRNQIPFINTYVYAEEAKHACVGFDNFRAAHDVADFVLQLGHRQIAMIAGISIDNDRAGDRIQGVRARLKESGIDWPSTNVAEAAYTIDAGRSAMKKLLNGAEGGFTAVICGSDILAFGALVACQEAGKSVPEDVSIVGFDNLEFSAYLSPPLTTVEVPAANMGHVAAEYLLRRLGGESDLLREDLETKLIVRQTTAPRKA